MSKRLKEILSELDKIENRAKEINTAVETADPTDVEKLNAELTESETRKSALIAEKSVIEQKEADARAASTGEDKGTPVETPTEGEERIMPKLTRDMPGYTNTAEYRNAFMANLMNNATAEQRDALITTVNGIVLPTEMENTIWDLIHDAHPIMEDITRLSTGTVLTIRQHKSIKAGKAKKVAEGVANDIEDNEFVNVTLSGNDYSKTCELSYAEAKMTQGALVDYLETEIAADLGETMATDTFAQIKTDLATPASTIAKGSDLTYKNMLTAFGKAKHATSLTIYASSENVYGQIYGMVDANGQPVIRDGVAMGASVKVDSAAGDDIFIIDPKNYEANMIQDIMIENTRDIEKHKIVYSGYARMQGTMRDVNAGAYIDKAIV
ncbi:MAG: phage major capsid protein [Solobacterium sp.]|jgi:HK97 family phage major capsid protein|nr:phage major capsid protein [Solobacterium sp.]MCH4226778.1 phage major capsid protein [Solobacterium sp.]MCH4281893.1 phage major capsid protein [Solobacterium sp.]